MERSFHGNEESRARDEFGRSHVRVSFWIGLLLGNRDIPGRLDEGRELAVGYLGLVDLE